VTNNAVGIYVTVAAVGIAGGFKLVLRKNLLYLITHAALGHIISISKITYCYFLSSLWLWFSKILFQLHVLSVK